VICPHCGAESAVLATRAGPNNTVQRRRVCVGAKSHRFSTYEVPAAVFCSAKQRARQYAQTVASRLALIERDRRIAATLHLGWRVLAERHGLTKTAIYLAAKRGRNAPMPPVSNSPR
jgi:hypothetical protein